MSNLTKNLDNISETVSKYGAGNVQNAFFILMGLVVLSLLIYLITSSQKNIKLIIKESKESNKALLTEQEQFNAKVLEKLQRGFDGIDISIRGIYITLLSDKPLGKEDSLVVLPSITTTTMLLIERKLHYIIQRNTLVENKQYIYEEIKSMIKEYTQSGKKKMKEVKVEENILEKYLEYSEDITEYLTTQVLQIFEKAITDIQELGKLDTPITCDKCKLHQEAKKHIYNSLYRQIATLTNNTITKTKQVIDSIPTT